MPAAPPVRVVVEGNLDEAIARRLTQFCGGQFGRVYGKKGRRHVLDQLSGYNAAAGYGGLWFVLVDLDQNPECAPSLVAEALPEPAEGMCFRIAVHQVEAWLLADRAGFASWAGVRVARIPADVESIPRPKDRLVDIVRQSRRRRLCEAIVPRHRSGRTEGPAYTSTLSEFVAGPWDVEAAARAAPSLGRAIECLQHKITAPPPFPA